MRRLVVPLVALSLLGAACSQTRGGALPRINTSAPTTTTTAPPAVAPLTGLPLFNPDIAARPAVMIKVGDDPKARPQSGLDKADLVYEERVEGNVVRFMAVFQSRDATSVGPVRSVRSTDAGVIAAIGGVFVYSGGIPPFDALARRQSGVTVITEDANGSAFHLRADRERPYKTYADTAEMRARASATAPAPGALFHFLSQSEPLVPPPGTTPASQATVAFGPSTVARWDWDAASSKWKRSINGLPQRTDAGMQLAVTNVILQTVAYRGTQYVDRAGSSVDEAVTVGSGDAVLLTGGQRIPLRWSKASTPAVTVFTDVAGQTLRMPAGQTWIALVPTGTAVNVVNPTAVATTVASKLPSQ